MFKKNTLLFLLCVCIGGLLSLFLGQDICFDIKNYHLYIPYAFLNGRSGIDFIAAGPAHTFFNPLPDIPFFLLFYYLNDFPRLTGFLLGGYYGLLLFGVCKLVPCIWEAKTRADKYMQAAAVFFSVTGAATVLQTGHSSNELFMGGLAVLSAVLLFRGTDAALRFRLKYLLGAAFCISFSAGLKYTAAPAAVGVGVACLFLLIKNKSSWKSYLAVISAALLGFLLADGYFLWEKYSTLGSPLFPYFNHIFKSPYFAPVALANSPLVPHGWKEWLFLPFLRLHIPNWEYQVDVRLLLGLISFIILLAWGFFHIKKRPLSSGEALLLCLFAGTYIPWVILFGNMRYTVFLEIISSLLFIRLLCKFLTAKYVAGAACIIAFVLFLFCPFSKWPRKTYEGKNLSLSREVFVEDDSLVLVAGHHSFLIPFLNPRAQYVGGLYFAPEKLQVLPQMVFQINPLPRADYQHNFIPEIKKRVQTHQGNIYILAPSIKWIWKEDFWKEYGVNISPKYCQVFSTNITRQPFLMCILPNAKEGHL